MTERVIAGRYGLEEPLGTGAMSEVWAATDTELERRVAIKLLGRNADPARFEREARAAAALSHPNICGLYDYGTAEDGRPFMVLECLDGGTLEERLAAGTPLPDDETEQISRDVAAGLAHAHARGVLHRDLKPGNILFDGEGRAKIADLGIARMSGAGTLTEAGTVLGTAAYISPEQARGEAATPASDVYSFGVILYRMLTGRLPFEADEPLALVTMHATEEAPPVSRLRADAPPVLESVAAAALAKDAAQRPQDGAALLAELDPGRTAVTGLAAAPPPPSTEATAVAPAAATVAAPAAAAGRGAPPPEPPRLRNLAIIGAALLLAGAGVAAAFVATGSSDPGPETTLPEPTVSVPKKRTDTEETAPATTVAEEEPATTEPTTSEKTTTTEPTTSGRTTTRATPPPPPPPPPPPTTDTIETLPTTDTVPTEPPPPPPPPPPPATTQTVPADNPPPPTTTAPVLAQ